ncbi:MAG TPA: heavy metal-binding domain-containing protein [Acidimicrobiales bacterium]|jgi:uncharacterized protein YbjQ (UPF0145 family)|nr:heavy metal-binding domain-containing protein [Acidimicrobiales bacterium]
MTDWDGRGLPPVAQRRIERAASSKVRSSLLSVNGQAAMAHFGFVPVGEVMGCVVVQIGFQGYGGCGWGYANVGGYAGYGGPTTTSTRRSGGYFGLGPYLDAIDAAWSTALGRMVTEAQGLAADGVVDVRITESRLSQYAREFVVLGTAVRTIGSTHVTRPFTTTLSGSDTAKLLSAGSTPIAVVIANAAGIRHDDWSTVQSRSYWAGNVEVLGYSELVHATRSECRDEFMARSRAAGADGAIVSSPMSVEFHALEVGEGHTDHVGTARLVGTAIGAFGRERILEPPIAVLSMKDREGRT